MDCLKSSSNNSMHAQINSNDSVNTGCDLFENIKK